MGSQILLSENGASAQRATYTQSALEGGLVFGDAPLPPREVPDVPLVVFPEKMDEDGDWSMKNGGLRWLSHPKLIFFAVLNIQSGKYGEITMKDTGARAFGWI